MGAAICWQCLNIIGISFSTALAGNAFMRRFFLLPLSGMINCSMSGCQGDSNPDSNNPSLEYRSLPLSSRYHRPFFPRPPWGHHGERNVEAIHRTQITVSPNLRGSGSLTKKPVQPGQWLWLRVFCDPRPKNPPRLLPRCFLRGFWAHLFGRARPQTSVRVTVGHQTDS